MMDLQRSHRKEGFLHLQLADMTSNTDVNLHKLEKECEPPHDKINKMVFAPNEDSDQSGHPPSLISPRCPHEETFGPQLPLSALRRL